VARIELSLLIDGNRIGERIPVKKSAYKPSKELWVRRAFYKILPLLNNFPFIPTAVLYDSETHEVRGVHPVTACTPLCTWHLSFPIQQKSGASRMRLRLIIGRTWGLKGDPADLSFSKFTEQERSYFVYLHFAACSQQPSCSTDRN
jgi:hypothetical protein